MPMKVIPQRDRKLNRLLKKGGGRTLRRGEALYEIGCPGREVFLVRAGLIRLTLPGKGERDRTVGLAGPWEMLGEEGLFRGTPRRTGAVAGESAEVTVLDGETVFSALGTSPRSLEAFLKASTEDLDLARAMADPRRPGRPQRRLARLLLHLASRWGREEQGGVRIPARLTHQLLGEISGIHRSTVTTLLNDWIYRDLLEGGEGSVVLRDPRALRLAAGFDDGPIR